MNKNDLITDLFCPPLVPDCFWLRAPETDKESDSVMRLDSSVFTSLLGFAIAKLRHNSLFPVIAIQGVFVWYIYAYTVGH
jgi:hypothetical protein